MDNRKLKLYFKDASQNQKSISVDYPKTDYTPDELRSAMDRMLASNVITTKFGTVTLKDKQELETITKRVLEIV